MASRTMVDTRPSYARLVEMPVLCQGQNDDLRLDTGRVRYWTSREPGSRTVFVEHLVAGRWVNLHHYNGGS